MAKRKKRAVSAPPYTKKAIGERQNTPGQNHPGTTGRRKGGSQNIPGQNHPGSSISGKNRQGWAGLGRRKRKPAKSSTVKGKATTTRQAWGI